MVIKRTGYLALRYYLEVNQIEIIAGQDSKYDFVINVAEGEFDLEEIVNWLTTNKLTFNF